MSGARGWDTLSEIIGEGRQDAVDERERLLLRPTVCPEDRIALVADGAGVLGCTFCGWRHDGSAVNT